MPAYTGHEDGGSVACMTLMTSVLMFYMYSIETLRHVRAMETAQLDPNFPEQYVIPNLQAFKCELETFIHDFTRHGFASMVDDDTNTAAAAVASEEKINSVE